MEIQILVLLFVSCLASTVVQVTYNGNGNAYENKLAVDATLFQLEDKQTHHEENKSHKINVNKYAKFSEAADNTSSRSQIYVTPNDFTNKIVFPLANGDIKYNKNVRKLLHLKQYNAAVFTKTINNESKSYQNVPTEVLYEFQYIEDTTNNANSSTDLKSQIYSRPNTNINTFKIKPKSNKYVHHSDNIINRKMRRASEFRNKNISYQSLCPTKRTSVSLETIEFEYRPNHYIEVSCAHSYMPSFTNIEDKNKICSEAGFSCMQINRTMHLIRRNKARSNECWESEIRVVPSGCECMWPKHYYGDILAYHESHKRHNIGILNGYIPYISKNKS